jgi:maleylacetoacetate isomerase/maleylpyruvate isomerase
MRLYTYFRSSAAFRVRIALNLKRLSYEAVPVHLLRAGGEQHEESFVARSPAHLVPVLEEGSLTLTQSLAIIEYLEESYPQPPLLPASTGERAQVRALALSIACDIHPLNNLRVMRALQEAGLDEARRQQWARHWIEIGFGAVERLLARAGQYCHGDTPGMADCCLVPQVFNALRVGCSLDSYPQIARIHHNCMQLMAFRDAAPAAQADAE